MRFTHSLAQLPDDSYQSIAPTPAPAPRLLLWNRQLAHDLGIDADRDHDADRLARTFAGNELPPGASPVALAYAGHQFGHFVPQLGDGRAHLIGELSDRSGKRLDIQLKGSGPTRYSRGGDGRCALGPAIREYLMSEALHALGVPTTRCLAVVTTGETVHRESPLPGAVVTRVAASHLRVGTLQYFAARGDVAGVRRLCDFAIQRHDPDIDPAGPDRYLALFERVMARQVALVIDWMRIGFVHGVMNTDNTALSGQTIDYGPCAMMNAYEPQTVFSSIDHQGRYAFGNQPRIAHWNMARLAECLVPLIDEDADRAVERLNSVLGTFADRFQQSWRRMMGGKLGLVDFRDSDATLVQDLLDRMLEDELDYTLTFQQLARALHGDASLLDSALQNWLELWRARVEDQPGGIGSALELMARNNPVVIPRNHHVEAVLAQCVGTGDGTPAERFLQVLRSPYSISPATADYQDPPAGGDCGYRTFCGT